MTATTTTEACMVTIAYVAGEPVEVDPETYVAAAKAGTLDELREQAIAAYNGTLAEVWCSRCDQPAVVNRPVTNGSAVYTAAYCAPHDYAVTASGFREDAPAYGEPEVIERQPVGDGREVVTVRTGTEYGYGIVSPEGELVVRGYGATAAHAAGLAARLLSGVRFDAGYRKPEWLRRSLAGEQVLLGVADR